MEAEDTNAGINAERESPQDAGVTGSTQEGPPPFRLTIFTSDGPLLSKRISLGQDGKPLSDGSACRMSRGRARRASARTLAGLAKAINEMKPNEALSLGTLRAGLPGNVRVITRRQELEAGASSAAIARTLANVVFEQGQPSPFLLDIDRKGMPAEVKAALAGHGSLWGAITAAAPGLAEAGRVERASTSAGLYNTETGQRFPGSGGAHIYCIALDAADIPRALAVLHDRMWLAGLGWYMVGKTGSLLERGLVDKSVGSPERLIFEGAAEVIPPLAQDAEARQAVAHDGAWIDTRAVLPALTAAEKARVEALKREAKARLADEAATVRAQWLETRVRDVMSKRKVPEARARRIVERELEGTLHPAFTLHFHSDEEPSTTVGQVLGDPEAYIGEALADPFEGAGYGRQTAMVMRGRDGWPWIKSFAHGGMRYELRHSADTVRDVLLLALPDEMATLFCEAMAHADLDPDEEAALISEVVESINIGRADLKRMLKEARARVAGREAAERQNAATEEQAAGRPMLERPSPADRQTEVLASFDDVVAAVRDPEPPMRDTWGYLVEVVEISTPSLHTLTAASGDAEETKEARLPAPKQPRIVRLDEFGVQRVIEQHIVHFVMTDDGGRVPVAPPKGFVLAYRQTSESSLPVVAAVMLTPLVTADGRIFGGRGLEREHGIVFRVPDVLLGAMPSVETVTQQDVARSLAWLMDEWLCDVAAAGFVDKAVLVACALTVLERALLADGRPMFFFTAGHRGSGKTTAANMIAAATTGRLAPATAWPEKEEERRKSIFALASAGLPMAVLDDLARGSVVSSESLNRMLTAEDIEDRVLGTSEQKSASASTIIIATGNVISPSADLASRSLTAQFVADRTDPENREFRHGRPVEWTIDNRVTVLRHLYTLLVGNARFRAEVPLTNREGRFKTWYALVGSAVERAAAISAWGREVQEDAADLTGASPAERDAWEGVPIAAGVGRFSFAEMVEQNEAVDAEEGDVGAAAVALSALLVWLGQGKEFGGREVADLIEGKAEGMQESSMDDAGAAQDGPLRGAALHDALARASNMEHLAGRGVKAASVGMMLKRLVGRPVSSGHHGVLRLDIRFDGHAKASRYRVTVARPSV